MKLNPLGFMVLHINGKRLAEKHDDNATFWMAPPTSFPSEASKGTFSFPRTSIDASFRFNTVMTISMPMKELPTTTSFFPSLAAAEMVNTQRKTNGPSGRNVTCINLARIVNTSECENILEVNTRDWELPGVTSGSEDELVVVNKFFASFQHDPLSRNVDGSDGLTIHMSIE